MVELQVVSQSFEDKYVSHFEDEYVSRWSLMTLRVMQVAERDDGGNDEGTWYAKSEKLYDEVWENLD